MKLVDAMGVEPTICLLAKQMPLPHSSHAPIKLDAFCITVAFAIPPHLAKLCKMAGLEPARAVLNCSY